MLVELFNNVVETPVDISHDILSVLQHGFVDLKPLQKRKQGKGGRMWAQLRDGKLVFSKQGNLMLSRYLVVELDNTTSLEYSEANSNAFAIRFSDGHILLTFASYYARCLWWNTILQNIGRPFAGVPVHESVYDEAENQDSDSGSMVQTRNPLYSTPHPLIKRKNSYCRTPNPLYDTSANRKLSIVETPNPLVCFVVVVVC